VIGDITETNVEKTAYRLELGALRAVTWRACENQIEIEKEVDSKSKSTAYEEV
jgi:hypothetical protein